MKYPSVYLHLGSNLGNRETHLAEARKKINTQLGKILEKSSIYETAAWGKEDQSAFLNQALEIETTHNPWELMDKILEIEHEIGRIRSEKWAPRKIDIDILAFGNSRIQTEKVSLPHPAIPDRKFVLIPLQEIAPNWNHPISKKSIKQLLENTADTLEVNILSTDFNQLL